MTTTHDVLLASIPSKQLLRDAYVDLHGYDVTWRKNSLGVNRIDDFGDVVSNATFVNSPAKVVINLAKLQQLMLNHANDTNEASINRIEAYCKVSMDVVAGDRIVFPQTYLAATTAKEMQVVKVDANLHSALVGKKIYLSPARS